MTTDRPEKQGKIRVEDGMAVICVPADEIHGLLVALAPCPCRAPKSNATQGIRDRLATALKRAKNQL